MNLIGHSWSVPVTCTLLQFLSEQLELVEPRGVAEVMKLLKPGCSPDLTDSLSRPGFRQSKPFLQVQQAQGDQVRLVSKPCNLVSYKGTDVLLTSSSEPIPKNHRLLNSLDPRPWRWKTICGLGGPMVGQLLNMLTS